MFRVVNAYLDYLKLCVLMVEDECCGECNVVSNAYKEHIPHLMQSIGSHGGEVIYFGRFCFSGELGILNCDDICMCAMIKLFELIGFVFEPHPLFLYLVDE